MSTVRVIRKSYTIRKMGDLLIKGDGNYGLFGGGFHIQRYPPEEAHNDDPNQPDVPAFAHTGALHEGETGLPGVGKVIPGDFIRGNHGEMVYRDQSGGEHLHGIDGVIRRIGEGLARQGVVGNAKAIVQRAIDLYNQKHPDRDNHLPDVDSIMWRKLFVAPYQRDVMNRGNYGPNGNLITTTTNSHGKNHRYGTFLESYSIPFHNQLDEVMKEAGFENPRQDFSFVGKPYIRPENLHFVINPQTGMLQSGAYHIPSGHLQGGDELPAGHMDRFSGMGLPEKQFQDLTSWDVIHHLPDTYFLPKSGAAGSTGIVRSAMEHMNHVLGNDTSMIGTEIKETIPLSQVDASHRGTPLQFLLSNQDQMRGLMQDLAKYPAFHALFGRTTKGSVHNKLHDYYADRYGDDENTIDRFLQHSQHRPDVYGEKTASGRRRTNATNKNAARIYSKALLSGHIGQDDPSAANSNFRYDALSPEEIAEAGVGLDTSEEAMNNAQSVRAVIEYLASMNSRARGHQERRAIPPQEEIDALAPYVTSTLVGGFGADPNLMGIPDHIRSVSRAVPSASAEPVIATPTVSGAPQGPPSAVTSGGPPLSPPTQAPPVAVADPRLTPFQQRRQAFAQATPAQVEQTMRDIGAVRPEAQIDPRRLQQFQQTVSDPYQTFLTDYINRSDDTPEVARDRLMKAVEQMQIQDAKNDADVLKYLPSKKMSLQSNTDVSTMAKSMGIAPIDVHTIVFTKGDWTRISKKYGYSDKVVKVVKTAFGGE